MRRNCNLELRLVPPTPSGFHDLHQHCLICNDERPVPSLNGNSEGKENGEQQQQLTIFFDGNVNICDVTELQARAIIMLASQEMWKTTGRRGGSEQPYSPIPTSPVTMSCASSPNGLSMKRSLQRFLQKRRHRIQATSPYDQH